MKGYGSGMGFFKERGVEWDEKLSAQRAKQLTGKTVFVQTYLTASGFSHDAQRMAALGFDVLSQSSNGHRGAGIVVTYQRRAMPPTVSVPGTLLSS